MSFNISYPDLVRIIKSFGHTETYAQIVADYLDERIDYEMDLSFYLWNTLLYNIRCFKNKEKALEYVENEVKCSIKDCIIYEGEFGVYLEWR